MNIEWNRFRKKIATFTVFLLTSLAAFVILIPILWMVSAAIRPIEEILAFPPHIIPKTITFSFFNDVLTTQKYQLFGLNSMIITSGTFFLTITLAVLAGYGLSRYSFKGRNQILLFIMSLLMLPPIVLVIPFFRFSNIVGIYDTRLILVIVNSAFVLPLSVWLTKSYIDSIPYSIEESAMMDGCNRIQVILRILLPSLAPGLVGTGTFIAVTVWNEYVLAVTLTDSPAVQPLTMGLAAFFGQYVRDWNSIMVFATLSSLPIVFIFIFLQRWVIQGLTAGAVK